MVGIACGAYKQGVGANNCAHSLLVCYGLKKSCGNAVCEKNSNIFLFF